MRKQKYKIRVPTPIHWRSPLFFATYPSKLRLEISPLIRILECGNKRRPLEKTFSEGVLVAGTERTLHANLDNKGYICWLFYQNRMRSIEDFLLAIALYFRSTWRNFLPLKNVNYPIRLLFWLILHNMTQVISGGSSCTLFVTLPTRTFRVVFAWQIADIIKHLQSFPRLWIYICTLFTPKQLANFNFFSTTCCHSTLVTDRTTFPRKNENDPYS